MSSSVRAMDKARATVIVSDWILHFDQNQLDVLENMIATYLADERERTQAPFRAAAERLERQAGRFWTLLTRDDTAATTAHILRQLLGDNEISPG